MGGGNGTTNRAPLAEAAGAYGAAHVRYVETHQQLVDARRAVASCEAAYGSAERELEAARRRLIEQAQRADRIPGW